MMAHVSLVAAPIQMHATSIQQQPVTTVHAFYLTAALMLPLATSAQIRFATTALALIPVAPMQRH
jgi:hypothetical protein